MLRVKLITGGNFQKRLETINRILKQDLGLTLDQPHPDILAIQGISSIGIDQIRNLKKQLALKPYQAAAKATVILEAEKMTIPAQNAFLKTLEETPINSYIFLAAPTAEFLLPTIISRCQLIKLPKLSESKLSNSERANYCQLFVSLPVKSAGAKLKEISKYASKKNLTSDFVLDMIVAGRSLMQKKPTLTIARNLRFWQKTYQIIQANVNPSLAIGNLFLLLS